jgi:hypothetical protein
VVEIGGKSRILDSKVRDPIMVEVEVVNVLRPDHNVGFGVNNLGRGRFGQGEQAHSCRTGGECVHVELTID